MNGVRCIYDIAGGVVYQPLVMPVLLCGWYWWRDRCCSRVHRVLYKGHVVSMGRKLRAKVRVEADCCFAVLVERCSVASNQEAAAKVKQLKRSATTRVFGFPSGGRPSGAQSNQLESGMELGQTSRLADEIVPDC